MIKSQNHYAERSQTEKSIYCMSPSLQICRKLKRICSDRKQNGGCEWTVEEEGVEYKWVQGNWGQRWKCLLSFLQWWFHGYTHMSKLIKWCTLNIGIYCASVITHLKNEFQSDFPMKIFVYASKIQIMQIRLKSSLTTTQISLPSTRLATVIS